MPGVSDGKTVRARVDWEAAERDYRTGKFTQRELAAKYGISHAAVGKHVREDGWTQDLAEQIRQATSAKLVAELVANEATKSSHEVANSISAAAELNKRVILGHRSDIRAVRDVAADLLAEIRLATHKPEQIAELFNQVLGDMDSAARGKAQAQFSDFMRLHSRVGSVHKLADTLSKLQAMERKAFDLDEPEQKPPPPAPSVEDIPPGAEIDAYRTWVNA